MMMERNADTVRRELAAEQKNMERRGDEVVAASEAFEKAMLRFRNVRQFVADLKDELSLLLEPDLRVRAGQIYADLDPREHGRTVRVDWVTNTRARCTVVTNPARVQLSFDAGRTELSDRVGTKTWISLHRMTSGRTRGWRYVRTDVAA
jgi:hypothetical protein